MGSGEERQLGRDGGNWDCTAGDPYSDANFPSLNEERDGVALTGKYL